MNVGNTTTINDEITMSGVKYGIMAVSEDGGDTVIVTFGYDSARHALNFPHLVYSSTSIGIGVAASPDDWRRALDAIQACAKRCETVARAAGEALSKVAD